MVEVKQRTANRPSQQFITKREKMLARIRAHSTGEERVRVIAVGERLGVAMRDILRHPTAGFFPAGARAAEWPLDQFTKRRLDEGVIKLASDQRKERRPR
jgi:hypothetical protein